MNAQEIINALREPAFLIGSSPRAKADSPIKVHYKSSRKLDDALVDPETGDLSIEKRSDVYDIKGSSGGVIAHLDPSAHTEEMAVGGAAAPLIQTIGN